MSPKLRKKLAGWLFILSLIAWPVSALSIFREEPQGILGLSWLALTLTLGDIWLTTDVRAEGAGDK